MGYSLTFSGRDVSREATSFSIDTATFHDPNAAVDALVTAFETALTGILQFTVNRETGSAELKTGSQTAAGTGNREDKILVTYHDVVTNETYTRALPCRLPYSLLPTQPNSDMYDLGIGPWPAFKTAFEALATSPVGNGVTLDTARLVGRNI